MTTTPTTTPEGCQRASQRYGAYRLANTVATATSLDGAVVIRVNALAEMLGMDFRYPISPAAAGTIRASVVDAVEAAMLVATYLHDHDPRQPHLFTRDSPWHELLTGRAGSAHHEVMAALWWHWRPSGWSLVELARHLGLPSATVVFLISEMPSVSGTEAQVVLLELLARRLGVVFDVGTRQLFEDGRRVLRPYRTYKKLKHRQDEAALELARAIGELTPELPPYRDFDVDRESGSDLYENYARAFLTDHPWCDDPPPEPYGLRLPALSDPSLDIAACVLENNGLIGIQRLLAVARRNHWKHLPPQEAAARPKHFGRLVRRLNAWVRTLVLGADE